MQNGATRFPSVIDSTMVNDFRRCPTLWAERYINRLELPGESVDFMFGGCFAKGVEIARKQHFVKGLSEELAITAGIAAAVKQWGYWDEPQGHVKNVQNLVLALDGYFKQWPLSQPPFPRTEDAIEYTFGIPLPHIRHPDNGGYMVYGGRFDMLGRDGDMVYPVDEKTTGSSMFKWAEGWNFWGQFIGYQWACQMQGEPVDKLLVRGIFVYKNEIKYIPHFTSATQTVIARWLDDLQETIEQMIFMYKRSKFSRVYGSACKIYRPCSYLPLCEATKREDWLTYYKEGEEWNPLVKPGGEL